MKTTTIYQSSNTKGDCQFMTSNKKIKILAKAIWYTVNGALLVIVGSIIMLSYFNLFKSMVRNDNDLVFFIFGAGIIVPLLAVGITIFLAYILWEKVIFPIGDYFEAKKNVKEEIIKDEDDGSELQISAPQVQVKEA